MFSEIIRFFKALIKWISQGCKYRSVRQIKKIHNICEKCPHFKRGCGRLKGYDACGLCGCNLHPTKKIANKIAWRTEKCPDEPPRW